MFGYLPHERKKKSKGPTTHLKGIIMPTLLAPKILSLLGRDILQKSKAERRGQPPIPPIEQDVVLLPARVLIAIVALYHCIPEPDACQAVPPPLTATLKSKYIKKLQVGKGKRRLITL